MLEREGAIYGTRESRVCESAGYPWSENRQWPQMLLEVAIHAATSSSLPPLMLNEKVLLIQLSYQQARERLLALGNTKGVKTY
ncbi:hypothetical protein KSX_72930 [Ktedonospora formicarum]|uniref:Uncharacterized protein n=1 Tax=Ktedonospora formicarum TaxID=2778364 RepID=A0A8J3MXZ6_9CHLR|nr:hypothetical protein KSX_72930 [Ktedonospora formicarum]